MVPTELTIVPGYMLLELNVPPLMVREIGVE
jgi:hypothetical protein